MSPAVQDSLSHLINGLHSLVDGRAYIARLIAFGPKATPALADLLLHGKRSAVSQPRQWIVEVLGGLRAYDVLLAYLRQPVDIQNPVVQHAEEAVQNAAARELAAYETEEAFSVLLDCLRRRPLPGIIETLGLYRRPTVAPYLLDYLEDDVCRSAAMEALQHLGGSVRGLLIESALTRKPPLPEFESASSLRRRQCCVRLLEHLRMSKDEVARLAPLLHEEDPDLVTAFAQVVLRCPDFGDYRSILLHLKRIQPKLGWWLQDEFRSLMSQTEKKLHSNANTDHL